MAILDRAAQQVLLVLPDSHAIVTIATAGQGPREISAGVRHLMIQGDTLYIPDLPQARVLRFSLSGVALSPLQFTPSGLPLAYGFDARGSLLTVVRPLRTKQGRGAFLTSLEVHSVGDGSGNIVARLPLNSRDSIESVKLFSPSPSAAVLTSGRYLAGTGREAHVSLFQANGTLARRVSIDIQPRELERDDAIVLLSAALSTIPQDRREATITMLTSRMGIESRYPHFVSILVPDLNRIWLRRPLTSAQARRHTPVGFDLDNTGSNDWTVSDSTGRTTFVVRIPDNESLRWVSGDTILVSRVATDGRSMLVRYVLQTGAPRR